MRKMWVHNFALILTHMFLCKHQKAGYTENSMKAFLFQNSLLKSKWFLQKGAVILKRLYLMFRLCGYNGSQTALNIQVIFTEKQNCGLATKVKSQ